MKFTDGEWLNKSWFDIKYASQAYEVSAKKGELCVTATPARIWNRGQTLSGPNLTLRYFSPRPDVIGVEIVHFDGGEERTPFPTVESEPDFEPVITIGERSAALISGKTSVVVSRGDTWEVRFYYDGALLTASRGRALCCIRENAAHANAEERASEGDYPWNRRRDGNFYLREQLSLGVGENIYGFGEKFTAFVKNGQTVDIWNADGGTGGELSYKSIPFYLSSKGYGVYVAHSENVSFEVATERVSAASFSVNGERLRYYVFGGGLKRAIYNYTALTGRPPLLPASSYGLWLSTSFTTDYDEKTVTSFIDGMAEREIPLSVFHFDCFWMKAFHWCDFEWDADLFPDAREMLGRLKARGLRVCVWVNPYISQGSKLFAEGKAKSYFIEERNGDIYQSDEWQPGMAVVDFTNPKAAKWYASKIDALCEMGVDYIKTDFGERIPVTCAYYDGSDPLKMHNYYTLLYNKTVFETLEKRFGRGNACLFARSASAGCQKYPVHWGGDCSASYESMAETLRGGLSLGLCGFGYYSHDISGFESTATPDLYKRWAAFGLLSSHSRLHGSSSYRVPWLFDGEAVDVLRHFTCLKGRLMPYLAGISAEASEKGLPVMRPMLLEFPDDPVCLTLDRQYMLGGSLLVAPVFSEDGEVEFYVPEGVWTDIQSGEKFKGGGWYKRVYDYFALPLLARPHSIIPRGNFEGDFDYDYIDGTLYTVYEGGDGETLDYDCYGSDFKKQFTLTVTVRGSGLEADYLPDGKKISVIKR